MTKQVIMDQELLSKFKAKFGEEVDPNNFYIIPVRAVSTEPIHQNTIYDGAVPSESIIRELADIVNFTDENVGVLIMHDSEKLNVGRVFAASVKDEGGVYSLRAHLAILKTDETQSLIAKIENNVLDEVSVGFRPSHAKCNKCGFDYLGDEATFENWFNQTCPEGHTIGVDGCHLELFGVDWFGEISIVNRGAAHRAKILDREKAQYKQEDMHKLAASAKDAEIFVATFIQKMEKPMNLEEQNAKLQAELAEMKKALDLSEKVKGLEASLSEANETLAAKDAEIASLMEEKETATASAEGVIAEKDAEIAAKAEEIVKKETELSEVKEFLRAEVAKVLVASGKNDVEVPEDLDGISKLLSENQQILASLIPAGGVSTSATTKVQKTAGYTDEQLKAFQVKQ